jgi:DnaJ-class molecular chaperone
LCEVRNRCVLRLVKCHVAQDKEREKMKEDQYKKTMDILNSGISSKDVAALEFITETVTCPYCHGTGYAKTSRGLDHCPPCLGGGKIKPKIAQHST